MKAYCGRSAVVQAGRKRAPLNGFPLSAVRWITNTRTACAATSLSLGNGVSLRHHQTRADTHVELVQSPWREAGPEPTTKTLAGRKYQSAEDTGASCAPRTHTGRRSNLPEGGQPPSHPEKGAAYFLFHWHARLFGPSVLGVRLVVSPGSKLRLTDYAVARRQDRFGH